MGAFTRNGANLKQDANLYLKALEVGLWDYDLDADILECDAKWHALLQIPAGMIREIADFRPYIHPDDTAFATAVDHDRVMQMIALDQRYHVDFRVVRSDGAIRWWRSVACLVVDSETGRRRAVGCVTDVSEFKETETPLIPPRDEGETEASADAHDPPGADLSARELECLRWVSLGKTAWETSVIMGRSRRTVEFHLLNAVRKLSASNKIHAAVIAVRHQLI